MYIHRFVEKDIEQFLADPKVIILVGPRQIGKTTLVEQLLRQKGGLLLNMDIEVDTARLLATRSLSPHDALKSLGNPPLLAIDEAQRIPDISSMVKGWYDTHIATKIILLGSSSLDLLNQAAEPLTGRNNKVFLTPLLFTEILKNQSWYSPTLSVPMIQEHFAEQLQTLLLHHMVYGSYPETINTNDKERYLLNLTSDYLFKDVLQLGLVKSQEPIRKLLTLLAYQTGSEVSVNELAATLGQSRDTVNRYLELLEKTFVIFRLHALSTNQRKEIGKNTKIFFWDTGIRNALLKEFSVSTYRNDLGLLFENYIIAEVAKHNMIRGERKSLYFWRKSDGGEVDLIIKGANTLHAYEIKWSKISLTSSARSFTDLYHTPITMITKKTILDLLGQFNGK